MDGSPDQEAVPTRHSSDCRHCSTRNNKSHRHGEEINNSISLDAHLGSATPTFGRNSTSPCTSSLANMFNASQPPLSSSQEGRDPQVDFVLVFESIPKRYIKPGKVPPNVKAEIAKEYQLLVSRIKDVGLQVTSREGRVASGTILLFVRANDEALIKIGGEEGLIDFLHGVRANFEPAASLRRTSSLPRGSNHSLAQMRFSSADRIRHLHTLLTLPTNPVTSEGISRRGAGLRVKSGDFPHLIDMTPLHDPSYNCAWLKRWGSFDSFLSISSQDLDGIRAHFGEQIAFYFGFLLYYFQSLASVAAVGGIFWIAGAPYHPLYSLALVFWACIFVESWRIKERKLAVRWGTLNCGSVESRRAEFKADRIESDKVTGEDVEIFEWWRKELRIACSVPAVAFFAALLALALTTMFVVEVFVVRLYEGPGKAAVPYIPMALFSICIPQILAAWQATATYLTSWENHFSQRDYDWAMTVKMFALQGFVAYGALTLSAFIYIPFGQALMDHIVSQGYFASSIADAVSSGRLQTRDDGGVQFSINPDRMHSQLLAVLTTSQAINAFTELALPFILRKVNEWRNRGNNKTQDGNKKSRASTSATIGSERHFLSRVASELDLPPYSIFGDYAEMATQFGYIVLWSVIWPLAPLGGLINNFFEMRGDALKICMHVRRPVPLRTDSIGPWLEILGFIAWLAAMNNSALVYLFQRSPESHLPGHSMYEATMRTHLHPGSGLPAVNGSASNILCSSNLNHSKRSLLSLPRVLPSLLPMSGSAGAMTGAFLIAFASEHGYGLARVVVRHVLDRVLWKDSAEEVLLKRREWEAKREVLATAKIPASSKVFYKGAIMRDDTSAADPNSDAVFWSEERDVGLQVIQSNGKDK